jgi:predicted phage tail component-like protein
LTIQNGFTFNGVHSSTHFTVRRKERPVFAPISTNLLTIPNMPGAYYQGKKKEVLVFNAHVAKFESNANILRQKYDELKSWLLTDTPSELIWDDEPNKTYFAIVTSNLSFNETNGYADAGVITFICPDPDSYGAEILVPFTSSEMQIPYEGTAKSFPKFKVTFNQAVTFFSLVGSKGGVLLGQPQTVDVVQVQQEKRVLTDDMSSLTNWVDGSVVDNGVVAGTMIANKFRASSYGTGSSWHGPAKKRSLPTPIQDFRVQAFLTQKSTSYSQVGRVEIYLLDVNNKIIGKVVLRDSTTSYKYNWAVARAGNEADNHTLYDGYGANPGTWNDFDNGILEIKRIGNVWEFYIAKRDAAGNHNARLSKRWRHTSGKYNEKLAQIQVHVGAYGTHSATTQSINVLYVDEIIQPGSNQVPEIAKAGDVIEIDHHLKKVLKNGRPFNEIRDPRSTFFPLEKGENFIAVYPPDISSVEMTYQPRWL